MFAASDLLRMQNAMAFEGVSAFLYICAVDALDHSEPHGKSTKGILKEVLKSQGKSQTEADDLAEKLWVFRCGGAHAGVTDRTDVQCTIQIGENLVAGKTMEEVMAEHRENQSKGPVQILGQLVFSENANLYSLARRVAAQAIANQLIQLAAKITVST